LEYGPREDVLPTVAGTPELVVAAPPVDVALPRGDAVVVLLYHGPDDVLRGMYPLELDGTNDDVFGFSDGRDMALDVVALDHGPADVLARVGYEKVPLYGLLDVDAGTPELVTGPEDVAWLDVLCHGPCDRTLELGRPVYVIRELVTVTLAGTLLVLNCGLKEVVDGTANEELCHETVVYTVVLLVALLTRDVVRGVTVTDVVVRTVREVDAFCGEALLESVKRGGRDEVDALMLA